VFLAPAEDYESVFRLECNFADACPTKPRSQVGAGAAGAELAALLTTPNEEPLA
jgi:hypothetical protein